MEEETNHLEDAGKVHGQVDFSNTKIAFQSLNDRQLYQSWVTFSSFRIPFLATKGPQLVEWAFSRSALGRRLLTPVIKSTIFRQFCGGESLEDCAPAILKLKSHGIGAILDYSVEGAGHEEDFIAAATEIRRSIDHAHQHQGDRAFAVFKTTGIIDTGLLEKISRGQPLLEVERIHWQNGVQRFQNILEHAHRLGVAVMVDAEETWIQTAIDGLTYEGMTRWNTQKPIVYNTLQIYRTDRLDHLKEMLQEAEQGGFILGIKLVRGAYLEKERHWARAQGSPSPLWETKAQVDQSFNEALKLALDHIKHCAVVVGSHNEESTARALQLMDSLGIPKNHRHVVFSQLLGMSDHLTYNLAHSHYLVTKYVPYGPLGAVLPYLGRRAEENSSIQGQIGRELAMIQHEIKRRKHSAKTGGV
jgi:proline dehydrogenase